MRNSKFRTSPSFAPTRSSVPSSAPTSVRSFAPHTTDELVSGIAFEIVMSIVWPRLAVRPPQSLFKWEHHEMARIELAPALSLTVQVRR